MYVPVASVVRLWLRIVLFTSALSSACSRHSTAQDSTADAVRNTETYVRVVAGLALGFRSITGRYPVALRELCDRGLRNCGGVRRLDGSNDGWGRPLVYTPLDRGFEIRSLGADGRLDTQDDQVFDLQLDRSRARRLMGCYEYRKGSFDLSSPFVRLDTIAGTVGSTNATYLLMLTVPGNPGEAEWYPAGQDSVVLQWLESRESLVSVRAHVQGDTIDAATSNAQAGQRLITLVRVPCED